LYGSGEGVEPEVLRLLRLALDQGNQAAQIVTEHLSRISSQIGSLVRPKPVRRMPVLPHRLIRLTCVAQTRLPRVHARSAYRLLHTCASGSV
jgi:hypothetical protein